MQITQQYRTETSHRLTNVQNRDAHIHGHSFLWEVTVRAHRLDAKNMVLDIADLMLAIHATLDPLDHCLVLAPDDPLWAVADDYILNNSDDGCVELGDDDVTLEGLLLATNKAAPRLLKWGDNPTAESFARWALHEIEAVLEREWKSVDSSETIANKKPYFVYSVKVWETATSYAEAKTGEG